MEKRRVIFHIENRGSIWMGHWFQFMISGLRHVNKNIIAGENVDCLNQNLEFYNKDEVKPPYYIHFNKKLLHNNEFEDFQLQTFDLIKDKFILVEDIKPDDVVVSNYGSPLIMKHHRFYGISNIPSSNNSFGTVEADSWKYLKELLTVEVTDKEREKYNKSFYIRRGKSHLLSGNSKLGRRRQIVNEDEMIEKFKELDIVSIFLEDYTLIEKIKIFMCAKVIISPNSSGLVFVPLLNENSKLLEINTLNGVTSAGGRIWEDVCEIFKTPYYMYYVTPLDDKDNMQININDFVEFIKNHQIV